MSVKLNNISCSNVKFSRKIETLTELPVFQNGEQGAWYDPSDTSTLFQDTSGTVPVTQDGQSVALMLDKSGNNNHAVQTSPSLRPIYKTNGVLHWLEGIGKYMDSSVFSLQANWFVSYVISMNQYTNFHGPWRFLAEGGSPTSTSSNRLEDYTRGTRDRVIFSRNGGIGTAYDEPEMLPAANTRYLAWAGYNPSATYHVGQEWTGNVTLESAPDLVRSPGSGRVSLFRGYKGDIMPGKMFEFVLSTGTPIDDATRSELNDYLKNKNGIAI